MSNNKSKQTSNVKTFETLRAGDLVAFFYSEFGIAHRMVKLVPVTRVSPAGIFIGEEMYSKHDGDRLTRGVRFSTFIEPYDPAVHDVMVEGSKNAIERREKLVRIDSFHLGKLNDDEIDTILAVLDKANMRSATSAIEHAAAQLAKTGRNALRDLIESEQL